MDETDLKIIRILCKDARTPFKTIAKDLKIGKDTVIRKYNKLKKQGLILGTTIVISSQACGCRGLLGIYLKLKPGASPSVVRDKLLNIPQINAMWQLWGDYDFYVESFLTQLKDIDEIISNLRAIKEIAFIDQMMYNSQDWPIPFDVFDFNPPDWALNFQ